MNKLKNRMLGIPIPPFISEINEGYNLIIDPQGMFYTQDPKNTCIVMKPFAQNVIKKMGELCNLIIFTRKRQKYIEPFLRETGYVKFDGIFDRSYETYRSGRKVKDIQKLGLNVEKTLVLDMNYERCYPFHLSNCIPVSKNVSEEELEGIMEQLQKVVRGNIEIKESVVQDMFKKSVVLLPKP